VATEAVEKTLQEKIRIFEKALTPQELLRLRQLRGADAQGNLLIGQACIDEALKRIEGQPHLHNDVKLAIQASLESKLRDFQAEQLSEAELAALLCQLSTKPLKVQSSYGVCD